ncbi:MAG: hypothetical protein JST96_13470, partial [Bacteroidetes bacterium]|nr:hypothetical protein [Bacteroidota bacterium]
MNEISNTKQKIYYSLRIAAAMCCIGHGAFGIITKPIWCNYFAVFGIGHDLAYQMMPYVGSVDILFGIILLVYPLRAIAIWLVVWGFVTASLRPLSGEPFAEMIERAGNFGAPLTLLLLCGGWDNPKKWFTPLRISEINYDEKKAAQIKLYLRVFVFLLLLGHGWLNLIHKKSLIDQYTHLGFSNPQLVAQVVGIFEVVAAVATLVKPLAPLLILFFIWKMGSELFYPHYEIFEWIERGGSYGCLLALWFAVKTNFINDTL